MTISSRSALVPGWLHARGGVPLAALLALAGCAANPAPPRADAPASDPRALAADLDALQRQPDPASDDVIASLERTLREQRERRARAAVAAGTATPLPETVHTSAATVTGPARTPMSRTQESHMPVDELYARARDLELQLQVASAIALYREASQRGHAPSSLRLMELYADGAPGVARDYRVAVFFKERAVQQGASFDPVWRR
jgi:TPR repeat protein